MIVTFFLLLDERRVVVVAVFALDDAEARLGDARVFGAISSSKTLTARRHSIGKRSAVVATRRTRRQPSQLEARTAEHEKRGGVFARAARRAARTLDSSRLCARGAHATTWNVG